MKSGLVAASFDPLAVGRIDPQFESTLRDVEDDVGSDRIMTPEHPLWLDFLSNLSRIPICTGTTRQAALSGLPRSTAHYWQVRSRNATGTTLANGGTWWKFTTR